MRLAGHVDHIGEMRNAHEILVHISGGKSQDRQCKHIWKDNIKTDLRVIRCENGALNSSDSG
jgi:hypothetical protein